MTDNSEIIAGLMAANETWGILFDAADAVKVSLLKRGYSETIAETIAGNYIMTTMNMALATPPVPAGEK